MSGFIVSARASLIMCMTDPIPIEDGKRLMGGVRALLTLGQGFVRAVSWCPSPFPRSTPSTSMKSGILRRWAGASAS